MRACLALLIALGVIFAGCESDSLNTRGDDPGIKLDAGRGGLADALPLPPDAAPHDAGVIAPDASTEFPDAEIAPDAEPPDAGAPECVCPTLPATCTRAAENTPVFSSLHDGAMQAQLFDVIACAETSLDIAIYQTTWPCVVDGLLAKLAADNDIVLNLVIDDDQCSNVTGTRDCDLARLDGQPRVTIVDDARSRYMHHKLVIADGREVWLSSGNFTKESFCSEANNSMVVREPAIVGGYATEFSRMFTAREFGPIDPRAPIEGGGLSLYFSPETPASQAPRWFSDLVQAVETASTSVDFQIFSLTRFEVGNAIIAAHRRGIPVRGVIAPEFRSEAVIDAMLTAGVPLRVGPVHSKVMIIDGVRVATGSPNWSENSWGNNEASLWIASSTIARAYVDEQDRLWATAMAP